jgi:hypothetical protein
MPELRRIGVLLLTQGTRPDPIEDLLLREDIIVYRPAPSTTEHLNSTNIADLIGNLRAFHKPVRGVQTRQALAYGHDPRSASLNECAAWRLARFLGSPYDQMVPVTVLRYHEADSSVKLQHPKIRDGWGSFASEQPGSSLDPEPLETPAVNDPAAFFDALIAQQDRHVAQYRWESSLQHLGLIDHGFAFARPGDHFNESVFVRRRHMEGREELLDSELKALERLATNELIGLKDILRPDQATALEDRIERMRKSGKLLAPGEW